MLGCCGLSASSKLYLEDAGEAEGGLDEVRVGREPVADFPHRLEEREPTLCEHLQKEAKIRFCKRESEKMSDEIDNNIFASCLARGKKANANELKHRFVMAAPKNTALKNWITLSIAITFC